MIRANRGDKRHPGTAVASRYASRVCPSLKQHSLKEQHPVYINGTEIGGLKGHFGEAVRSTTSRQICDIFEIWTRSTKTNYCRLPPAPICRLRSRALPRGKAAAMSSLKTTHRNARLWLARIRRVGRLRGVGNAAAIR